MDHNGFRNVTIKKNLCPFLKHEAPHQTLMTSHRNPGETPEQDRKDKPPEEITQTLQ